MALLWWFGDRIRLVRNLAPPMAGPAAERALERIYQAYGRQLYREHHGREPAGQARRELAALQKALSGLSPRAVNALQAALAQEPRVQAAPLLNMRVVRHLMRLTTDRAMTDMPLHPYERPPDVGGATLHAITCSVWCTAGPTACCTRHGILGSTSPTVGGPFRSRSGACALGTRQELETFRAVGERREVSTPM
jgi:hypothetical protein